MNDTINRYTWPDAITHFGDTEPAPEEMAAYIKNKSDAQLVADGLSAWGIAHAGGNGSVPKSFGHYIVAIGQRLGISATGDNLHRKADELLAERRVK